MTIRRLSFNGPGNDSDCINFEPETDGKSAFSVDTAFRAFRHQRDIFYELFNRWRNSHNQASFLSPLNPSDNKSKFELTINRLVSLSHDASNMYHLSKLFVSQLIRTCVMGGTKTFLSDDQTDQFLSSIQNDKLSKLRKRLDNVDSKPSTFNDEERFFYEFIITIKSQSFHQYLKLMLIQKIRETNDCMPVMGETEEDINGTNKIKQQFTMISLTLQVLAKFLGFVVFLPYSIPVTSSAQFMETQSVLRKEEICCINCIDWIKKAIETKKLSITLPWILQFLRQMDPISPRLKAYQEIIRYICKVKDNLTSNRFKFDPNTKAYLTNIIDSFITDYHEHRFSENGSGIECGRDSTLINFDEYPDLIDEDYITTNANQGIKSTHNLIASPQKNAHSSPQKDFNRLTPRKIRPLTLTNVKREASTNSANRELQFNPIRMETTRDLVRDLENDFLSLHPMSLVKVVELVSDRIYSRCIKQLKHSVIGQAHQENLVEPGDQSDLTRKSTVDAIRSHCSKFAHDFCSAEIPKTLPLLLSEHDYTPDAINFTSKLAVHKSCEKCCQWIIGNINPQWLTNFFKNPILSDDKLDRHEDVSIPFNKIRDCIKQLLVSHDKSPSQASVVEQIVQVIGTLTNLRKSSLPDKLIKTMDVTILDAIISIIVHSPRECDEKSFQVWMNYWTSSTIKVAQFVCPRNCVLLSSSRSYYDSWDKYIQILTKLINADIYPIGTLQSDCLATFKRTEDDQLGYFKSSLKTLIYNQRDRQSDRNLLQGLLDYLVESEDKDFPKLS